jgi:succinate dehydrogenase/fumarate reductase cytochrome b subunit
MCNGIRHMIWDMGYLFKKENATRSSIAVLICAAALTACTWYCAVTYGGAGKDAPAVIEEGEAGHAPQ